ncbi:hypothetical protein HY478_01645, partial [Candidatus Uhrbacteria bacterium]|nr:hypothetical protein [Candidatus Uhrbacteria bacterium]
MRPHRFKILLCGILLAGGILLGFQLSAFSFQIPEAQALDVGVNAVDEEIGLSAADPRIVVARIIRVALGLLGVVTVVLILYGGFVWMTASGNEENIAKAKRILTNASIGLVIVLTSFAITQFVLSRLVEA